jgi:hypothetical protein
MATRLVKLGQAHEFTTAADEVVDVFARCVAQGGERDTGAGVRRVGRSGGRANEAADCW